MVVSWVTQLQTQTRAPEPLAALSLHAQWTNSIGSQIDHDQSEHHSFVWS